MTKRIEYIDLAKGICIALVVLYHIWFGFPSLEIKIISQSVIYTLPLFFFLSGLVFRQYDCFKTFLKKKVNSLLIPFLFFYLVFTVIVPNLLAFVGLLDSNINSAGCKTIWQFIYPEYFFNGPVWFLLSLFEINCLFYFLLRIVNSFCNQISSILCCAISLILGYVGYSLGVNNINLPMFLDSSLSALPFFTVGYILRSKIDVIYDKTRNNSKILLNLTVFISSILLYYTLDFVNFRGNIFNVSFMHLLITGFVGIISILCFCMTVTNIPLISYWGRYSIHILVTHNVLIVLLAPFINKFFPLNLFTYILFASIIMLIYHFIIIPFSNKYLPYVTGQKPLLK